jgi:arylsulfatase A-like enzyme
VEELGIDGGVGEKDGPGLESAIRFTPVSRRAFLQTLALGTTASVLEGSLAQAADKATRKPNILFILADDLGYGDLGCYGQKQIQTPNLDRIATEGIRFTDCYSGSTVCAPSRCCLMTGMHTGHARIRGNARVPLLPENTTVAEVLKKVGYSTGLIGKWGLGESKTTGTPTRQGFDEFFGYLNQGHAHNYYPEHLWNQEEMMEIPENLGMGRKVYSHDLFTERALDYLTRHKDHPFFLYLAYTIPHANNERGRDEGNGMEVPDYGPYKDQPWPDTEKGRAAMITRMDKDIGKILDHLKQLGIEEETILFFTSDNGPHHEGGSNPEFFQSSGPLKGIKRDLYEGGIRVPMLARCPGKIPAGGVSNQVWAFWDFLPTAADLGGGQAPEGIDGLSMVPALLGGKAPEHEFLYWEFHEGGFKQAVRMGQWKAVRLAPGQPLELYHLGVDPGEKHNIAAEQPEAIAKIEEYLKQARTESEDWPIKKT